MKQIILGCLFISCVLAYCEPSFPGKRLIGHPEGYSDWLKPGETLAQFNERHDIGWQEWLNANPTRNPAYVLPWQRFNVPQAWLAPDVPQHDVVINLSAFRAFVWYRDHRIPMVCTFPVGIGMLFEDSPVGFYSIVERLKDPIWHPTVSARLELARKGQFLPKEIAPGLDNPMGSYALRLNRLSYLLHGTNRPGTVGRRSSGGCLHFYNKDIEILYKLNKQSVMIVDDRRLSWQTPSTMYQQHYPALRKDFSPVQHHDNGQLCAVNYTHRHSKY
jgi:L,D-transpeptidase ErfK/SrfK